MSTGKASSLDILLSIIGQFDEQAVWWIHQQRPPKLLHWSVQPSKAIHPFYITNLWRMSHSFSFFEHIKYTLVFRSSNHSILFKGNPKFISDMSFKETTNLWIWFLQSILIGIHMYVLSITYFSRTWFDEIQITGGYWSRLMTKNTHRLKLIQENLCLKIISTQFQQLIWRDSQRHCQALTQWIGALLNPDPLYILSQS